MLQYLVLLYDLSLISAWKSHRTTKLFHVDAEQHLLSLIMNMTSFPILYISPFFVSAGNITSYRFKYLMMLWTQLLITLVNSYYYTLIWKILFTSKLSAYPLNVESVTLMFSSSLIIGFFIQRIRIMIHNASPPWHLVQRPVYL